MMMMMMIDDDDDDDDDKPNNWPQGCGRPLRQARRIHINRIHPNNNNNNNKHAYAGIPVIVLHI
jgi:hypothetical protein